MEPFDRVTNDYSTFESGESDRKQIPSLDLSKERFYRLRDKS